MFTLIILRCKCSCFKKEKIILRKNASVVHENGAPVNPASTVLLREEGPGPLAAPEGASWAAGPGTARHPLPAGPSSWGGPGTRQSARFYQDLSRSPQALHTLLRLILPKLQVRTRTCRGSVWPVPTAKNGNSPSQESRLPEPHTAAWLLPSAAQTRKGQDRESRTTSVP